METPFDKYLVEGEYQQMALFSLPPTQTGIDRIFYEEIKPQSSFDYDETIDFHLKRQYSKTYIHPKASKLYITFRIFKENGDILAKEDDVVATNLISSTLWKDIIITIQGKQMSMSGGNHAYISYLHALLEEGIASKSPKFVSAFYFKDENELNEVKEALEKTTNNGSVLRREWGQLSKTVELECSLFQDFFQIDKYILTGVDIDITFIRNSDKFLLLKKADNDAKYKIEIKDVKLKLATIDINENVAAAHRVALKYSPALYPYRQRILRVQPVPTGSYEFTYELPNIKLPSKIVFGFLNEQTYNGDMTENCFNFQNCNITQASLNIGGESIFAPPYKNLNFGLKKCIVPYEMLNTIFNNDRINLNITLSEFAKGYTLFPWSIKDVPVSSDMKYMNKPDFGNLTLRVDFAESTKKTIVCVAYLIYDRVMQIDKDLDVKF